MNFYEASAAHPERFAVHYAIGIFLLKAIYSDRYSLPNSVLQKIHLTDKCTDFLNKYQDSIHAESEQDLTLGAFLTIGTDECWVDYEKTDYDGILSDVSSEIRQGRIRFPWVFGSDLIQKYSAQPFNGESNLDNDDTHVLLSGTPQGVFQLGKYVCGPFGILISSMERIDSLVPSLEAPIQYCPDPACRKLHNVRLSGPMPSFLGSFKSIRNVLCENDIEVPALHSLYESIVDDPYEWYDSWNSTGLPVLVGNGFVCDELQEIVSFLIDNTEGSIRSSFPKDKRLEGSSKAIVGRLSTSELMQLSLLATDKDIVAAIETCIYQKRIVVPRGEIRTSRFNRARGGWLDYRAQCSADGVRFVPSDPRDKVYVAQNRLRGLLLRIFPNEESREEQLDYVLRAHEASSLEEKLQEYISTTPPNIVIKDVFLPVVNRVKEVEKALQFGVFRSPDGGEGDIEWIRRVAWKLGYESNYVDSCNARFDEHHRNFYDVIRRNNPAKASGREIIRQASISYFVALEEILDLALSFSAWALCSDHYGATRFKFCSKWAKASVTSLLSKAANDVGLDIAYEPSGHWTLYPLIEGFRVLSRYLPIIDGSQKKYIRDRSKYPGFSGRTDIAMFPFEHTMAFLDLSEQSKKSVIEHLEWVSSKLQAANVCSLRNRLEHNRPLEDFPNQDELENMCLSVMSIMNRMELAGSLPNPMLRVKVIKDQFDRELTLFKDFRGREVEIRLPHELSYSVQLDIASPVVIFKNAVIRGSSVPLQFNWIGVSKYADYWRSHPGRRYL